MVTFDPHPLRVLAPHVSLQFLASFEEKATILEAAGVDQILCVAFTREFSALSPEAFVRRLLCDRLMAKEVFVGEDFSFGKDRSGRVVDLRRLGKGLGFSVHTILTVNDGGRTVSSSRIRSLLIAGRVGEAAGLLGRLYSIEGQVIAGKQQASSLGFPTANLHPPEDRVIPADGVYAAWGVLEGHPEQGVAYIGTQPTLGPYQRTMELHLFKSPPDLSKKKLRIGFQELIREERVFEDQGELVAQIREDIQKAKHFMRSEPVGDLLVLSGDSGEIGVKKKG